MCALQNFSLLAATNRVRPTKAQIVEAMVGGIGGLCTVRNPFLLMLLNTLGFKANFLSCAIHLTTRQETKSLDNAHIALLATVDTGERFWVDVGNGHPYVQPLSIDAVDNGQEQLIKHPFLTVRLVKKLKVYHIQHRLSDVEKWRTNHTFTISETPWSHFDALHYNHNHPSESFRGPFRDGLRFNLWSADGNFVVVRFNTGDCKTVLVSGENKNDGTMQPTITTREFGAADSHKLFTGGSDPAHPFLRNIGATKAWYAFVEAKCRAQFVQMMKTAWGVLQS